jgi:6-phosphogluconate dehydrogenase
MNMYIAKPNSFNEIGQKFFDDVNEAINYLEEVTGYAMGFHTSKKTGKVYDWELVGKLVKVE